MCFRQMQQVQGLNKNYENRSGPFIDTYSLIANIQYLYWMK